MTRSTGSQISSYGNGWCDIVQAPLISPLRSILSQIEQLRQIAQTSREPAGEPVAAGRDGRSR